MALIEVAIFAISAKIVLLLALQEIPLIQQVKVNALHFLIK